MSSKYVCYTTTFFPDRRSEVYRIIQSTFPNAKISTDTDTFFLDKCFISLKINEDVSKVAVRITIKEQSFVKRDFRTVVPLATADDISYIPIMHPALIQSIG